MSWSERQCQMAWFDFIMELKTREKQSWRFKFTSWLAPNFWFPYVQHQAWFGRVLMWRWIGFPIFKPKICSIQRGSHLGQNDLTIYILKIFDSDFVLSLFLGSNESQLGLQVIDVRVSVSLHRNFINKLSCFCCHKFHFLKCQQNHIIQCLEATDILQKSLSAREKYYITTSRLGLNMIAFYKRQYSSAATVSVKH